MAQEISRLEKELQEVQKEIQRTEAKLGNERFLQRAPAEVVQKEKTKKKNIISGRLNSSPGWMNLKAFDYY